MNICALNAMKMAGEERDRKSREAAEKSKEWNFPELAGTEKQVKWGHDIEDIRHRVNACG